MTLTCDITLNWTLFQAAVTYVISCIFCHVFNFQFGVQEVLCLVSYTRQLLKIRKIILLTTVTSVITAGSSIIYISLLYKSTNVSPEIS